MATKTKSMFTFCKQKFRSPKGEARWAYLRKPDTKFNKECHKITVFFDPKDPELAAIKKVSLEFQAEYFKEKGKKAPAGLKFLKIDEKTGRPFIQFKTGVRRDDEENVIPVPVVDAKKAATKTAVWSGDIVRVAFSLAGWETAQGIGVKPFLNAVQLLESKGGPSSGADVFEEEDGFSEGDKAEAKEQSKDAAEDLTEEDLDQEDEDEDGDVI